MAAYRELDKGGRGLTGKQVIEMGQKYLMQNYAQLPLVIARGEGVRVWDTVLP